MAEEAKDVNTDVESASTSTESSTVEKIDTELSELDFGDNEQTDEPKKTADEPETETKSEEESSKETEQEPSETDTEAPEQYSGAEKRKQQLNTEIRDKVAERNQLRAEIAELNKQKYQLGTVTQASELVSKVNPDTGDYYTKVEAELAQLKMEREVERQQREIDAYTEQIVERTIQLKDESERVLKEYPMFDPESPEYNKPVAEAADAILAKSLQKDAKTGQIIGCNISPYQLYSTIAQASVIAMQKGEASARKNVQKMMNSTDVANSPSSVAQKTDYDPYIDGFDS